MVDDGIDPMENFSVKTTDINLKNHHIWVCPVYVLDARLQGNIAGLIMWEPQSRAGIYIGHSPLHAVSVGTLPNGYIRSVPIPGYNPDVGTVMTDARHYSVQKST